MTGHQSLPHEASVSVSDFDYGRYHASWREPRLWKLYGKYKAMIGEWVSDRSIDVRLERKRKNLQLQDYLKHVKSENRVPQITVPPALALNMCEVLPGLYFAANRLSENRSILRASNLVEWGNSYARFAESVDNDPIKLLKWNIYITGSTTSAQLRMPTSISLKKGQLDDQTKLKSPSKTSLKLQLKKTSDLVKSLNSMTGEEKKRMESMSVLPTCYVIKEDKKDPVFASPHLVSFVSVALTDLLLPGLAVGETLKFSSQGIAPKNCPLVRIPPDATHVLMTPNTVIFTNEVMFKVKTLNVYSALVNMLLFFSQCCITSKYVKFWYVPFDNVVSLMENSNYCVNLTAGLISGVVYKKRLCDNNGLDNYGSSREDTKFAFSHVVDREYIGYFLVHHFSSILLALKIEDRSRLAGMRFVFGNVADFNFSEISRGTGKPNEKVYESHRNTRAHYAIDIGLDLSIVVSRMDPKYNSSDEAALCISAMFANLTQNSLESGEKMIIHVISHDCETLLGLLHQLTQFSAKTNDSAFANMQPFSFEMPRMWNQVLLVNRQFIRFLGFSTMFPSVLTSLSHKIGIFISICLTYANKYGPSLSIYSQKNGYADYLEGVKQFVEYTILHAGRPRDSDPHEYCFLTKACDPANVNIAGAHMLLVFLLARKNMNYSTSLSVIGGIHSLITDPMTQKFRRPGDIAEIVIEHGSVLNDERTFPPPEALLLHAHRIAFGVAMVNSSVLFHQNAIEMQVSKKGKSFRPIMLTASMGILKYGSCIIVKKCACKKDCKHCLCGVSNRQFHPVCIPCSIFCLKWTANHPTESLALSVDQALQVVEIMTAPNFRMGFPQHVVTHTNSTPIIVPDFMETEQKIDAPPDSIQGKQISADERKEQEEEREEEEEEEEEEYSEEAAAYEEELQQEQKELSELLDNESEDITQHKLDSYAAKISHRRENVEGDEMTNFAEIYNDEDENMPSSMDVDDHVAEGLEDSDDEF